MITVNESKSSTRLLIINCPSEYFVYIPMGTFGLCDYLSKKNIPVYLLNLSLYKYSEIKDVLKNYLDLFKPSHVGLIFHWQETVEEVYRVGEEIKSYMDSIKVICGGFTAGYFGRNLLERFYFLDFLIKGDPEKPMELLLNGCSPSEIPNLIFRDKSSIYENDVSYFIDKETLSSISYCNLNYLFDYEEYIKAIDKKLGFPLFIGRGCLYNCRYCGGSAMSYRLHSSREKPVMRSVDSVISDLKRLKDYTRKIYLCHENEKRYIMRFFKKLKKEKDLIKIFQLNYGAWHLPDNKFMELYRDIFLLDGQKKPLFEISPEMFDDTSRKKIRSPKLYYSMRDLKENISLIHDKLGNSINMSIFFSRYHDTADEYGDVREEIIGIFKTEHELFLKGIRNVRICYDHLSTDVGSSYWEKYIDNRYDIDTLISAKTKVRTHGFASFPFDNLCIYLPAKLSEKEIVLCEMIIKILKRLRRYYYELFHILFHCLNGKTVDLIEEIVNKKYINTPKNVFNGMDDCELLEQIYFEITQNEIFFSKIPFIRDLTDFLVKKTLCRDKQPLVTNKYKVRKPRLNDSFISVNMYDYLNLPALLAKSSTENPSVMIPDRTVFVFLNERIMSMTYGTYCATIKNFENGISLNQYYDLMKKRRIFTPSYHKDLIEELFQSGVLY